MIQAALTAWLITLAAEVPIVALVYPQLRGRMAIVCAITTSSTNLFMNLVLFRVLSPRGYVLYGELGALVIEAAVYWLAARPRDPGRAIVASSAANLASYGAGLLLLGG